jgi:hypothetical protein
VALKLGAGAPGSGFWNLGLGLGFAMPLALKRYYGRGHLHFLTFSCYQRRPFFETGHARDVFVHELGRNSRETALLGYVMMPEHVHLLIHEPPGIAGATKIQNQDPGSRNRNLGHPKPKVTPRTKAYQVLYGVPSREVSWLLE